MDPIMGNRADVKPPITVNQTFPAISTTLHLSKTDMAARIRELENSAIRFAIFRIEP
jgi:hypothetical protein